jgi:hypothetical protein
MKTYGINSLDPNGIKLISQAFDEAWEYVAGASRSLPLFKIVLAQGSPMQSWRKQQRVSRTSPS